MTRGIARTFQITQLLNEETALANVTLAIQARQGHSYSFFANARRDLTLLQPAMDVLRGAGLETRAGVRVEDLSHGEHKQLELAIASGRATQTVAAG